jgi:hypothetical protein
MKRGGGEFSATRPQAYAVRKDLAAVLEQYDPVAQQAPPLFWVRNDDVRRVPVRSGRIRAPRFVRALRTDMSRAMQ